MKTTRRDFLESVRNPYGLSSTIGNVLTRLNRIERAPVKFNLNKPNPPKRAKDSITPGKIEQPSPGDIPFLINFSYLGGGQNNVGFNDPADKIAICTMPAGIVPDESFTVPADNNFIIAALALKFDMEPVITWEASGAITGSATLVDSKTIGTHTKVYLYKLVTIPGGTGLVQADLGDGVFWAGLLAWNAGTIGDGSVAAVSDIGMTELHDESGSMLFSETFALTDEQSAYLTFGFIVNGNNFGSSDSTEPTVKYDEVSNSGVIFTSYGDDEWAKDPDSGEYSVYTIRDGGTLQTVIPGSGTVDVGYDWTYLSADTWPVGFSMPPATTRLPHQAIIGLIELLCEAPP